MTEPATFTEDDLTAADACVPNRDVLSSEAYLISRGVRPAALLGHCPADRVTMLRVRTLLFGARDGLDVLVFVLPQQDKSGAAFGYAAHRWVIDLMEWAVSGEIPPVRKHEILGLLLGYSPAAIARHQEADGLHDLCLAEDGDE